jgi:hypothetical protein
MSRWWNTTVTSTGIAMNDHGELLMRERVRICRPSLYERHLAGKKSKGRGTEHGTRFEKKNGLIIVAVMTALLRCETVSAQDMKPFLTLKTAKAMAEASDKKASDMGIKVHIAIVDDGGNLKYYLRQDGRRWSPRKSRR